LGAAAVSGIEALWRFVFMLTKNAIPVGVYLRNSSKIALALSFIMAASIGTLRVYAAQPTESSEPSKAEIKAEKKAEKAAEKADKQAAKAVKQKKNASAKAAEPVKMDKATKDLGGANASDTNKHAIPLKPVSARQQKENNEAADAINKIPGVNIQGKDLQPPADDPEIKGFHPIKKLLAPVIRLGKAAVQMQQQMMKLEGPVGALEPAMVSLQGKLQQVDNRVQSLDGNLVSMDCKVIKVSEEMTGIKQDLGEMRSDVSSLRKPLQSVLEPLTNVKGPLDEVRHALTDMHTMMTVVLLGIVALTLGIVFGTPLVALYVFANRHKFFPDMKDHEFPMSRPQGKEPVGGRR